MTTYNFATDVGITPTTQTWELVTNTKMFQSPLTNAIQTQTRKGSYWKTVATFDNLTGEDRAKMQAFLAKLDGQVHRMYFTDYGYNRSGNAPSSDSATNLLVKGAGQTGSVLLADGADRTNTNYFTDYFKAGDYIAFNNEFHIVTADCDTTALTEFTYVDHNGVTQSGIPIAPPLRKPTDDNDPINFTVPLAVMIVTSTASWDTRPGRVSNFKIEAIEDVLA
jgi:hypothetical protein